MCSSDLKKLYFIYNNTTGAVTVKVSGQTGVSVASGSKVILVSNGTDIVAATSYSTGASAGGSNTQVQYNSSGSFAGSANLTFNGTTLTANTLNLTNALGTAYGGTGSTSTTYCSLTANVSGTLPVGNGGTGQTTYTNGQLLIGNTTGNTLTKSTLTAGSGITITNGAGSITIAASGGGGGGSAQDYIVQSYGIV